MDRLAFLRAQSWLEDDVASSTSSLGSSSVVPPLRTAEHEFSSHELYEGLASFSLGELPEEAEPGAEEAGAEEAVVRRVAAVEVELHPVMSF